MSREKKGRLKATLCGLSLGEADVQAVRRHWASLSLEEKLLIFRFEDPLLIRRLQSIWHDLVVSDLTCYMCGLRDFEGERRMHMFAIEGYVGKDGWLQEGVLFVKGGLAGRSDLFEFLEQELGSAFLQGRPSLHRRDWPLLFREAPHSWSELRCQILKLLELAIAHTEQESVTKRGHLAERAPTEGMTVAVTGIPSRASSKRRARKKRNLALHKAVTCPVCDGTGMLLADPCPLCADEDDNGVEEEPQAPVILQGPAAAVAEVAYAYQVSTSADTAPMSTDVEPTEAYSTESLSDPQEEAPAPAQFLEQRSLEEPKPKAGDSRDFSSAVAALTLEAQAEEEGKAAESDERARLETCRVERAAGSHLQKLRRRRAEEGGAEKLLHYREQAQEQVYVYGVFAAGFKIVVKNTFLVIEQVPTSSSTRGRRRSHSMA
jgi:hypothetical protein